MTELASTRHVTLMLHHRSKDRDARVDDATKVGGLEEK
jgi:hypothetical protein